MTTTGGELERAAARPLRPLPATAADWRLDDDFTWPAEMPWSVLGPQFQEAFGRADPADPQPEHAEFVGQNGSGKTHAAGKIYQERAFVTGRASILAAHKPIDKTLLKIGWPIAHNWQQVQQLARDGHINLIYWPRTSLMGDARTSYYDRQFSGLLDRIWASTADGEPADTDVIIDDFMFAEEELPETRGRLKQYLREGRGLGLSVGALKQRAQGGTRLTSSETQWTLGFRPKDDADLERWAELFGARRQWMPVLRSLDRERKQFIIKHTVTQLAYISWMDQPLVPLEPPRKKRGLMDLLRIPSRTPA